MRCWLRCELLFEVCGGLLRGLCARLWCAICGELLSAVRSDLRSVLGAGPQWFCVCGLDEFERNPSWLLEILVVLIVTFLETRVRGPKISFGLVKETCEYKGEIRTREISSSR